MVSTKWRVQELMLYTNTPNGFWTRDLTVYSFLREEEVLIEPELIGYILKTTYICTTFDWSTKQMQCNTSIIVLLLSAAVSVASPRFSSVNSAMSSYGWYCEPPFCFLGPKCPAVAWIPLLFTRVFLLVVIKPPFNLRFLFLYSVYQS